MIGLYRLKTSLQQSVGAVGWENGFLSCFLLFILSFLSLLAPPENYFVFKFFLFLGSILLYTALDVCLCLSVATMCFLPFCWMSIG